MRAKAGWFVALLYLFCVLAPGVALAVGDAASCLIPETHTAAAHVHDGSHGANAGDIKHEHSGHEHSGHQHSGHGHDKASPGPCCAMLCVSAIAADLPSVAKPSHPISTCVSENFQRLPGEAPPLLYRPPIA